jgi:putative phosphoribosyl transferase
MDAKVPQAQSKPIHITEERITLEGDLCIPSGAQSVVLFAHGSGSSRYSPRNRFVAHELQSAGFATLLLDLLTSEEEETDAHTHHLRFDIDLLAQRLAGAIGWLRQNPETRHLQIGCFGASTGAGAAMVAAARCREEVRAIVSRGGRPDLAGTTLRIVQAPTLLIVGSEDTLVIELNEWAYSQLSVRYKRLAVVFGATHLFSEPGALEEVARLACEWFAAHLATPARSAARERFHANDPLMRR